MTRVGKGWLTPRPGQKDFLAYLAYAVRRPL